MFYSMNINAMQSIEEYIDTYLQLLAPVEDKYPDFRELKTDYSSEKYPSLFNDDGVIYSEDRRVLLFVKKVFLPTEEYHVLEGTEIIYEGAFANSNIHSIVLPQSLQVIGSLAFWSCRRLEFVYLPENVEYVGYAAFDGEYIDRVDVSEHNSHIQVIDTYESNSIFSDAQPYKALSTCGGKFLFYLKTINTGVPIFPQLSKVEYWGAKASFDNDGRNMLIEIPTSVKIIGPYSFDNCAFLESVNFKDLSSLEEIGTGAFQNCRDLIEVDLCNSVIVIGDYAFYRCTSLTKIETPASLQEIGVSSFCGCSGLNDIKFNEGLVEIGTDSFHCCGDIDCVKVSSTVQNVFDSFNWNTRIKKIVFPDNFPVPLIAFGFADIVLGDMSQYSFEYGKDMILTKDRKVMLGYIGQKDEVEIPEDVEELDPKIILYNPILILNKRIKSLNHMFSCRAVKLCQEIEIADSFYIFDEETGEFIGSELWIPKNLHDFAEKLRNRYSYMIREI